MTTALRISLDYFNLAVSSIGSVVAEVLYKSIQNVCKMIGHASRLSYSLAPKHKREFTPIGS